MCFVFIYWFNPSNVFWMESWTQTTVSCSTNKLCWFNSRHCYVFTCTDWLQLVMLWEGALSPWARLARRRSLEFSRQVCLVKIYTTNIILFAGGLCVSAWCVSVMLPHCSCSQRPWPLSSRLTSRLDSRLTLRSCSSLLSSGKIGRIVFTPLSCLRVVAPTTR